MKVIYSGPYTGHTGGPDKPYEKEFEFNGTADLEVPSCGWIKFEVAPGIWIKVSISEWGSIEIRPSG